MRIEPGRWAIPPQECEALLLLLIRAEWAAQCGCVSDGFDVLRVGEEQVRDAEAAGRAWSGDLRECWESVVDEFSRRYGVADGQQHST